MKMNIQVVVLVVCSIFVSSYCLAAEKAPVNPVNNKVAAKVGDSPARSIPQLQKADRAVQNVIAMKNGGESAQIVTQNAIEQTGPLAIESSTESPKMIITVIDGKTFMDISIPEGTQMEIDTPISADEINIHGGGSIIFKGSGSLNSGNDITIDSDSLNSGNDIIIDTISNVISGSLNSGNIANTNPQVSQTAPNGGIAVINSTPLTISNTGANLQVPQMAPGGVGSALNGASIISEMTVTEIAVPKPKNTAKPGIGIGHQIVAANKTLKDDDKPAVKKAAKRNII